MSKMNHLKAEIVLASFSEALGGSFERISQEWDSQLGRLEKDIVSKSSKWTVAAKGKIVNKEGHSLQLNLNAPLHTLVRYGIMLANIRDNGSTDEPSYRMDIQAQLPADCVQWFKNYQTKSSEPVAK